MALVLLLFLNVGGFVLLIASFAAIFFNQKLDARDRPARWRWLWERRWNLGILLGLLSAFSCYPVYEGGKWFTFWGIPFLVAAAGGGEGDPHGPGIISVALNILFWLLLPQCVLWVTSGPRRKAGAVTADPGSGGQDPRAP